MTFRARVQTALRIIRVEPVLVLTLPFAAIVVGISVLIRPILLVRYGFLRSDRLGHFAANHDLFLVEDAIIRHNSASRVWDVYYFGRLPPCNAQLARMWTRRLRVWSPVIVRPCSLIVRAVPSLERHVCGDGAAEDRDILNLLDDAETQLHFTQDEIALGVETLRAFGVSEGAQFICVTVRDSSYTTELYSHELGYHSYRNCNLSDFEPAMLALAEKGVVVFRMGSKVNESLSVGHPNIIDYATNGYRTDFMDVYLGAHCLFCLSTSTGFDAIPQIFRRPVLTVNLAPIGAIRSWARDGLCLGRRYLDRRSGRLLSLREALASPAAYAYRSEEFEMSGIELLGNTPSEIRDAALEMLQRVTGSYPVNEVDQNLQVDFRRILQDHVISSELGQKSHGEIRSRYSSEYLRSHPEFLE